MREFREISALFIAALLFGSIVAANHNLVLVYAQSTGEEGSSTTNPSSDASSAGNSTSTTSNSTSSNQSTSTASSNSTSNNSTSSDTSAPLESTVTLEHSEIQINNPVEWVQTVTLSDQADVVAVELPADAQDVLVTTDTGQSVDSSAIVENPVVADTPVVTLDDVSEALQDNAETMMLGIEEPASGYDIAYETPAPYTIEDEHSTSDLYQKDVTVTHDSALHYTDVKTYSDIPEDLVASGTEFSLYWMVDGERTDVTNDESFAVTLVDTDNNGIVDQIRWIVPQLSEQQFVIEGIIVATKAEHFDANRNFVEDVFPQIQYRDDIWTSEIPAGDYIRVTFEKPLNSTNDITIFARSSYANSTVEVYEKDGDVLLATFNTISLDSIYKIYLTNLDESQDTFDLRIAGNPIEFDRIIDPAQVTGTPGTNADKNTLFLDIPKTISTGTNRLLLVGVSIKPSTISVSTITLRDTCGNAAGQVSFTSSGASAINTGNGRTEIWELANPGSGSKCVHITLSGSVGNTGKVAAGVVEFIGVDQTDPTPNTSTAISTSASTNPSASVSTSSGNVVFGALGVLSLNPSVTDPQTSQYDLDSSSNPKIRIHGSTKASGSPSTSLSWTLSSSEQWAVSLAEVKSAPTGSISWEKRDNIGNLQGGATFSISPNPLTGASSLTVLDNDANDADGDSGQFKINSVIQGTYTVTETIAPSGWARDSDLDRSITVSGSELDAVIGTQGTDDTGTTDESDFHNRLGSIQWEKRLTLIGNPEPLIGGATFTITPNPLTGSGSLTVQDNEAGKDGNPADGQFLISNARLGTYTIAETIPSPNTALDNDDTREITVSESDLNAVIGLMGSNDPGNSDESDFHDRLGSIAWEKRDNTNTLQGGATFTITDNPLIGSGILTVIDNVAPDADPDAGQFLIHNVLLDTYIVEETGAPTGWLVDPVPTRTVTVSSSDLNAVIGTQGQDDPGTTNDSDFHNIPDTAKLTVTKIVINDDGGDAVFTDFPLFVSGDPVTSGVEYTFSPGDYTITETGFAGYSATIDGDCAADGTITMVGGQTYKCTITNDDIAPTLKLVKEVTNDNGGTAAPTDWDLTATGTKGFTDSGDSATFHEVLANEAYTLSELGPSDYAAGYWNCDGGNLVVDILTLDLDEDVTCTITNDDDEPSLTLMKVVVNDDGGTATESGWTLTASGPTGFSGTGPSVSNDPSFDAGSYDLSESGPAGYDASDWVCVGGTQTDGDSVEIGLGEDVTCTITNDDIPPSLTLVKQVTNDNGGTAVTTDFTLSATGPTSISGAGGATSDATFSAGTYTLSETTSFTGYSSSSWTCEGGSQSGDQITLNLAESATCTITNNDIAPILTLVKTVINDDGGTASASDFTLSASGPTPISGAGGVTSGPTFSAGTYTLSETSPSGYTATAWSCVGGSQSGNQITLTVGESATCTITNNDNNVAPSVGPITAPITPVQINTAISASASFTDPGCDTHTASFNWGDNSATAGVVTESCGSGSASGSHTYASPGVYTITLTVTDNDGASGQSTFMYVVVYDPNGGFVTGGGFINSPKDAYPANPSLTGKANFGFVSKYLKGAVTPSGDTEFQFHAAGLNFKSKSYDWLVISGTKAQYKGVGTINGAGNYGFLLSAIDGGSTDKFRLKIWDKNNPDTIVYDNNIGNADTADPSTIIAGGSIVIHK